MFVHWNSIELNFEMNQYKKCTFPKLPIWLRFFCNFSGAIKNEGYFQIINEPKQKVVCPVSFRQTKQIQTLMIFFRLDIKIIDKWEKSSCHQPLMIVISRTMRSKSLWNSICIFAEGHKILQNLRHTFDWHYMRQK